MTAEMSADSASTAELVTQARSGDQDAWNAIVDRYASLVWSICRSFRLGEADAADVSQTVWLRTVEHLPRLREPAALPGWLSTTTRNECLRALRVGRGTESLDDSMLDMAADEDTTALDAELLAAERRAMVREGFAQLPAHCQRLLALLVSSQHRDYAEISAELSIAVGSIGPTRARCLDKLRHCPALELWTSSQKPGGPNGQRGTPNGQRGTPNGQRGTQDGRGGERHV